jgi:hypothetical protein
MVHDLNVFQVVFNHKQVWELKKQASNIHIYNIYVKYYTVKKFNNSKEISKVDRVIPKRELISLLPFTAKQKQKRRDKLKKWPKNEKRNWTSTKKIFFLPQYIITWIIVHVIIYQYLLSGVQQFLQKKPAMIFRAVCLKFKVVQTIS